MPTIKVMGSNGQLQEMSPDQLKTYDPSLYSEYVKNYEQPQAQLKETQAATGAAGASALSSTLNAEKSQHELKQQAFFSDTQKRLDSSKGKDGYVSPDTYNALKNEASGLQIDSKSFDDKFSQTYTNPNNIYYNTEAGIKIRQNKEKAAQQVLPLISSRLKEYSGLKVKGPIEGHLAETPLLKGRIGADSDTYESTNKAIAPALKSATAGLDTTGLRLNLTEINNMANLLPSIYDSASQAKAKVTQLNDIMTSNFGQGLPSDILSEYGVGTDSKGRMEGGAGIGGSSTGGSSPTSLGGAISGPINSLVSQVKGGMGKFDPLSLLKTYAETYPGVNVAEIAMMNPQQKEEYRKRIEQNVPSVPIPKQIGDIPVAGGLISGTVNAIPNAVKGALKSPAESSIGGLAGDTLDVAGGAFGVEGLGSGVNLLKSLFKGGAKAGAGLIAKTGAKDATQEAISSLKSGGSKSLIKGFGDLVQKAAIGVGEQLTGGTKDFVARNVNLDNAKDMGQSLLDHGVLSPLTGKGKIEATQKALVDVGRSIGKKLSSSKETIKSSELTSMVEKQLTDHYGNSQEPVIKQVVDQLAKEGIFDLKSGEQFLNMETLNKIKTGLEEFGLRAINIPQNGPLLKDMAKDAARVIRNYVAKKVPEATNDLRDYGALRTYMDDILTDPKGIDVASFNNIIKTITSGGKSVLEKGTQGTYNIGKFISKIGKPAEAQIAKDATGETAKAAETATSSVVKPPNPGTTTTGPTDFIQRAIQESKQNSDILKAQEGGTSIRPSRPQYVRNPKTGNLVKLNSLSPEEQEQAILRFTQPKK